MKFGLNKRKLQSSALGRLLVFLAVFGLVFTMTPQTAQAGFKERLPALAAPDAAALQDVPSFPVAGTREPLRTLTVVATAYSSDPAQTDDTPCLPAMWRFNLCEEYIKTGVEDTIAANFLALGTQVRFPELYGDRVFTVRDAMNARYNYRTAGYYRIDFYKAALGADGKMDVKISKQRARDFGVKYGLKMEVLALAR